MEKLKTIKEEDLTEFLVQSNFIENERTQQAHDDARLAWEYLLLLDELTVRTLLRTHEWILTNLAPHWAGHYRDGWVRVGSRVCAPPEKVPGLMQDLIKIHPDSWDDIKLWHIRFENVHPFFDGNGRTGRIIMNWQRIKQGLPLLIIHEGTEQHEYYKWFE